MTDRLSAFFGTLTFILLGLMACGIGTALVFNGDFLSFFIGISIYILGCVSFFAAKVLWDDK